MRSRSGPGTVSSVFAVVTNITCERSNGDVEVVVAEVGFCSGSSTSSIALAGSPRKSAPILSISSIMNSGLLEPASRSARTIVPGIAPM